MTNRAPSRRNVNTGRYEYLVGGKWVSRQAVARRRQALALPVVLVYCEGCESEALRATDPFLRGWAEMGRSRKNPGRLARWCPRCRCNGKDRAYSNPSAHEVKQIIAEQERRR